MNTTQRQEPFPLLLFINITTLSFGGIGILASLLFIMLIVSNGTLHTLTNILTLNSSLSILFLSGDMLSIAAFVLYRDLRQRTLHISVPMENMFLCQLRGYAAHIFFCALIYSYVIQAFYRLVGTIFCHRVSFQQKRIYKYAIGLQWLFSVMQTLPVGLGNNQIFIEHEYLCLVALDNRKTVGYLCVTSYLIPYTAITVMYVKIAKAVREKEINGEYYIYGVSFTGLCIFRRRIKIQYPSCAPSIGTNAAYSHFTSDSLGSRRTLFDVHSNGSLFHCPGTFVLASSWFYVHLDRCGYQYDSHHLLHTTAASDDCRVFP